MNERRIRVFISCGQGDKRERKAAARVAEALRELGFDPYLATQFQSVRALRENIFDQLRDTEYFCSLENVAQCFFISPEVSSMSSFPT